jgi:hypothetical protein
MKLFPVMANAWVTSLKVVETAPPEESPPMMRVWVAAKVCTLNKERIASSDKRNMIMDRR